MVKNAKQQEIVIRTFLLLMLGTRNSGGPSSPRHRKNTAKKACYSRKMAMRKRASRLRKPVTLGTPNIHQVYLTREFVFNRTLSELPFSPESTSARPSLDTLRARDLRASFNQGVHTCTSFPTRFPFTDTATTTTTPLYVPESIRIDTSSRLTMHRYFVLAGCYVTSGRV